MNKDLSSSESIRSDVSSRVGGESMKGTHVGEESGFEHVGKGTHVTKHIGKEHKNVGSISEFERPRGVEIIEEIKGTTTDELMDGEHMKYHTKTGKKFLKEPTLEFLNRLVAKNTHCFLGRTGVKLGRISLGTMNFGKIDKKFGERPGQLEEDEAHKILDRFLELGGNCIDTADFFPWFGQTCGESERIIGNWLKNHDRERIFLTTKIRMPVDPTNVNSGGLSRAHIIESVNKCLKRLGTNYIDLLLINGWDETVSIFETVRDLDEMVKLGKIRYFGACDFKGWQLQKFIDASRILNCHKCVCVEGEYNLLTRGVEWEVIEVCRNERIGFLAYSPFKYGFLTEDYDSSSDRPVEGTRIEAASHQKPNLVAMAEPFEEMIKNPIYSNLLDVCEKISKKHNMTTSQIAILWALQKGFVTSVVLGVSNVEELEENFKILTTDLSLTFEEMCELNEASSLKLQYPYQTLLSSVAGYKMLKVPESISFEQLSVLTDSLSLEEHRQGTTKGIHGTQQMHKPIRGKERERETYEKPMSGQYSTEKQQFPEEFGEQTKTQRKEIPVQHLG